jgi:hypothetical protein
MLPGSGLTKCGLFLLVCLLAGACRPAKFGEPNPKATFRGYGHCQFEGSYFIGCGSNVPFWLNCREPSMLSFVELQDSCDVRPCSVAGVYLELEGELSPEGSHGHLGLWKREITPTHIHYASGVGPSDCTWTPHEEWIYANPFESRSDSNPAPD